MGMYGVSTRRPRLETGSESYVDSSQKDACDINNIVRRFVRDGFISHLSKGVPVFADVSEVGDYRSALEQVRAAQEYFAGLPAKVRSRFRNDVAVFLDEAGQLTRDELRELGLAELRKSDRQRRESDVVEPPAPGGAEGSGTVSS